MKAPLWRLPKLRDVMNEFHEKAERDHLNRIRNEKLTKREWKAEQVHVGMVTLSENYTRDKMLLRSVVEWADIVYPTLLDRREAQRLIMSAIERLRKKHNFLLYAHPEHPGQIFLACKENPEPSRKKMIQLTTSGVGTVWSARLVATTQGAAGQKEMAAAKQRTERKRRTEASPFVA